MDEQKRRSILKAVSWRITGTIDTMILSWIITGKFTLALSIGAAELFTKILLYYLHERFWNKVSFGKNHPAAVSAAID
jgi:uncharacterized membrane protein